MRSDKGQRSGSISSFFELVQLAPAEGMETDPDSATLHRLLMAYINQARQ